MNDLTNPTLRYSAMRHQQAKTQFSKIADYAITSIIMAFMFVAFTLGDDRLRVDRECVRHASPKACRVF